MDSIDLITGLGVIAVVIAAFLYPLHHSGNNDAHKSDAQDEESKK